MVLTMTPIVEAITAGVFTVFVLLLICGLAFRRRSQNATSGAGNGFNRLISYSGTSEESQAADEDTSLIPPIKAFPRSVTTWDEPLIQAKKARTLSCPIKPRSLSCPIEPRPIPPTVRPEEADGSQPACKTETLAQKRDKRRRAKTEMRACQIQFSIFYNFYHLKLFLKLVCADNIPSTFGVTYGSYIKAELLPGTEKLATKIQYHTNNPVYEETVEFLRLTYDELMNKSLQLKLFTLDRFSRSCLVGRIVVPFDELEMNAEKPTTLWRRISSGSRQSVKAMSSKEILDKGELYISLRYQLLSNQLKVVVMKATNLPQANKIFPNNPYVIVKLLLNLDVVQTKKTTCKHLTSSPCWNEPLVFELDENFQIFEYSLCFKVKSRNKLFEDPTLGELQIGCHADGLGKEHWKDMVMKKNQARAVCHKIG